MYASPMLTTTSPTGHDSMLSCYKLRVSTSALALLTILITGGGSIWKIVLGLAMMSVAYRLKYFTV
jgi:hypothetical protein